MKITINDDFNLEKIVNSGQCFRPRRLKDGRFMFIYGEEVLFISQCNNGCFEISCDKQTFDSVWFYYFDLSTDYASIRRSIPENDIFLMESATASEGIRILRQDKWEMVISYIISQRKSIPSIRSSIEKLCRLYGHKLTEVDGEDIYSFPSALEMKDATSEELSSCGLGYRVSYILDAIEMYLSKKLNLEQMDFLDDEELFVSLKLVKGIGDKVANCVMLFGYHRISRAPVDTWILKVINEKYDGVNPFGGYGEVAGVMQQFIFYYVQNRKGLG